MKIIAHRGYWLHEEEKNTTTAFVRAVESGFGIETDLRDQNGRLIIAHDVPLPGQSYLSFDAFLEIYSKRTDADALLAINIKSDGLQHLISDALDKHQLYSYFTFDMSIPMLVFGYCKSALKYYTSINEYVRTPVLLESCSGIWLDAYTDIWYEMSLVEHYLQTGKPVCIVSPELHGREYMPLWNMLKESGVSANKEISICTDIPADAKTFFSY